MDAGGDRVLHASNIAVIREIYDNEFSPQCFAEQLEKALEAKCIYIVIEPGQLGDETARWIMVGNCLNKSVLMSGAASVVLGFVFNNKFFPQLPFCIFGVMCCSLYTASWQFDSCVKYQVEKDVRKLARIPDLTSALSVSSSPVVLVRKEKKHRIVLQWTLTLSAVAMCAYRVYKSIK